MMREAIVTLLLKPGKDPQRCQSYRLLSLLNHDYKILAKILATRFALLVDTVLCPYQSGFVPGRSTTLNLRTLFCVINQMEPSLPAVAVLLYAEKAFDSLEWTFLYAVLQKLGLPLSFVNLIKLLYTSPVALLRVNGMLTRQFSLTRGTRQGCPLSPLLFIAAMDPLARYLQEHHLHPGLQLHTGPLLASFYADDIMLLVRRLEENLSLLLCEITRFGVQSGLVINCSKSELFALIPSAVQLDVEFPMKWCTDPPKYLGITLHTTNTEVIRLNYGPVISRLTDQVERWIKLPLSIAGRIAIIKMVVLPRFLYLFLNIPLTISFFNTLRTLLIRLIWAGKHPQIGLKTLMLPFECGGFGVPDFYLYYLIAQTHFSYFWYHPDSRIQYLKADCSMIHPRQLTTLIPAGMKRNPADIETVATACWAWNKLR